MSRTGYDEIENGCVKNGFDYKLQVWVKNWICQDVGLGKEYAGQDIRNIYNADKQEDGFYCYGGDQ